MISDLAGVEVDPMVYGVHQSADWVASFFEYRLVSLRRLRFAADPNVTNLNRAGWSRLGVDLAA